MDEERAGKAVGRAAPARDGRIGSRIDRRARGLLRAEDAPPVAAGAAHCCPVRAVELAVRAEVPPVPRRLRRRIAVDGLVVDDDLATGAERDVRLTVVRAIRLFQRSDLDVVGEVEGAVAVSAVRLVEPGSRA